MHRVAYTTTVAGAEAMAMAVTISGKTVPEIARILTEALTPLMRWFGQLLQGLPPL